MSQFQIDGDKDDELFVYLSKTVFSNLGEISPWG